MKCLIVHNPASGSALTTDQLRDTFREQGYDVEAFVAIGKNFEQHLKRRLTSRSLVAVVGGDGTISAAVQPIIEAKATLLPLPGGTLNHFTKDLGIAQTIPDALRHAATSRLRRVDVASLNNRYFINNSALGLYPASLTVRSRFEDKLGKWPAAVIGAIRAIVSFHHYRLTINGVSIVTPFVFVGNNHYDLSALKIGARHHLDQGILTVAVATARTRTQLLKTFLLALIRRLDVDRQFEIYTVDETLAINSRRDSLHVSADGEIRTVYPPLTYRIHKKVLKIRG